MTNIKAIHAILHVFWPHLKMAFQPISVQNRPMSTLLAAITSPNSLCTADFIKLLECKVAAWKISVRSPCYLLWWINYFSSTCSQNLNSFGHREVGEIVFLKIVTTFTLVRLFVHNLYGNIVGVFWDGSTKNGLIHYHIGVGNV